MFYEVAVKSHVRVAPSLFNTNTREAVLETLKKKYENYVSKELGFVILVMDVVEVGDGVIIPGDGAAYYETIFKLLTYKPEMQEIVIGRISDIADFGAFMDIGTVDGMIHISQTMDDFVSFSKSGTLTGKESKKVLKVGDKCRARIIAISYKDISSPKIGLTMRQPSLGKVEWIEEELKKEKK